ncbi:Gpi-anchored leucine-rich lipoprotein [Globisporangium polare]
MWKTSVVATLLCALSAFSPSVAIRSGDEVCTLSSANQCAADSITPSALDGSVLIYPGGKTRCAFDDFTDSKGVFSTNKTFFFQVFPKQQKKKVMLFFQGGGACSDSDTCGFSLQCSLGKSSTFTPNATPGSTGILNHTASDNLFKDWNVIHIPYCTGDLHIGNAVVSPADSVFASLLGQSQCLGKNMATHMVGYENTQAALKWALANYPNPEHLIVGGSSAGSLAAQAVSALVADMWKVESSSMRYSMLGDSYVGVLPEETKPASAVLDYFGTCDVDLNAPAAIVAACKNHTLTVTQLFSGLIKEVAYSDWLFIDSKADKTQRYFYQLVKDGILGYPFANLMSGADFFTQVTTMINAYKTVSSRISTFFVEGEKHVFLSDANYTSVLSDAGDKLGEFLTKWLLPHSDPSVAPTPVPVPAVSPASTPAPGATPTPAAVPGVTPQTTPSPVQVPGTTPAPATATPAPAAGSSPSPAVTTTPSPAITTTTPSVRPGC